MASLDRTGKLARSSQSTVFAGRSATDLGGPFVGCLQEMRFWEIARSAEEINLWKHRSLPTKPMPTGLVGLWGLDLDPPQEMFDALNAQRWSEEEIRLAHLTNVYRERFNSVSSQTLTGRAQPCYSDRIDFVVFIRARDGYAAFYEPSFPEYLEDLFLGDSPREGILVYDTGDRSLSQWIQSWTGNRVKILTPLVGARLADGFRIPGDVDDAKSIMLARSLVGAGIQPPTVFISPPVEVDNDLVGENAPHRVRALAPVVELPNGQMSRQFTWLFADFWFVEPTRGQLRADDIAPLVDADLHILQWAVALSMPAQELVNDAPRSVIETLEDLFRRFGELLDRPGVQEVRDIQPFLADPKHWILLSPSARQVWPQKMLGNKYRVDFVVRESDDSYSAIEIEDPNAPVFTKDLNPHHKLTHAEQQVRDYCEYVDQNKDSVEREERLPGIFRPRGVVVIGRRGSLSQEANRKLVARNRDGGRYSVMVYDDLIERTRSVVDSIKRATTV